MEKSTTMSSTGTELHALAQRIDFERFAGFWGGRS